MSKDVKEVVVNISAQMMYLSGKYPSINQNKKKVMEVINNGKAFEKFKELVSRQGGDISYIEDVEKFEKAPIIVPVISEEKGYVEKLNAGLVGKAGIDLGIGRIHKDDDIDSRVGIVFGKKIGDRVKAGDILAYVHANSVEKANNCVDEIQKAYKIGSKKIVKKNIIDII